jgi:hypothetical protein
MATLAKLWTGDSYDAARLECEDTIRSIGRTCQPFTFPWAGTA